MECKGGPGISLKRNIHVNFLLRAHDTVIIQATEDQSQKAIFTLILSYQIMN